MTIGDIIIAYLLAVALVPLCACAYTLTGAMPTKDIGTTKANHMMGLMVKLSAPYMVVITLALGFAILSMQPTSEGEQHGLTPAQQERLEELRDKYSR